MASCSSSAAAALSFPSTSRLNDVVPSTLLPTHNNNYNNNNKSSYLRINRSISLTAKASYSNNNSGGGGDDPFGGFYPWDSNNTQHNNGTICIYACIEWEQQETITLFTADGLVQIGGLMVPKRVSSAQNQPKVKTSPRLHQFKESNYMDPAQGLCLGALFDIAATNGLDMGRRLCIIGFCRSIEMLSDVVEDTVLEHGGEVVVAEKASKGGLNEKLSMTVAVPLLWGVPPASDSLQIAVRSGGGIVDKVFWQWNFW
uniref:uncharacterized protein LOC122582362 isoform X2 n=1 Tax=Erigeron canadensis TaxID=72917 RepID=UPI001CB88D8F|nr:uncharacterized protein LOC122582362 isoform X2 [Erigeron canadensis]